MEKISTITAATHTNTSGLGVCRIETPLGSMTAVATEKGLALLAFGSIESVKKDLHVIEKYTGLDYKVQQHSIQHPILQQTIRELDAYFKGQLKIFTVPLDFDPIGNEFAKSAWQTLLKIPYGITWTYKQQAESMNNPLAIRAIAAANGRNPIAVIVPCHRVIGSNGSLTGYAGGVEKKRWLLLMEKNNSPVQAGRLF